MTLSARQLMIFSVTFYLVLVGFLVVSICIHTGGHFIYALDDPYIHLALAENLAHGHYGINPGEASSPSSSLLWPFLLVPFAGTVVHPYLPLFWCLLSGVAASALIGWIVFQWQAHWGARVTMSWPGQVLMAALLVLLANLASLTIVGMEHVLQVLLALCCSVALMEALSDRAIPWWCLAAAALGPSVRYEDLSLTLAVCVALAAQKRWGWASAVMGLSLAPLAGFSLFLRSEGLPLLPLSVLIKGGAYRGAGHWAQAYDLVRYDLSVCMDQERWPVTVLCLLLIALVMRARTRSSRLMLSGAVALGVLQMAIGRFNWFHRYEVYAVVFLTLVCVGRLMQTTRIPSGYYAGAVAILAVPYMYATLLTVTASVKIYRQQYQMHRFVTTFYNGNYAVNDLGWVSFERRPGSYVLDIFGLGSLEAASQRDKSSAWLEYVAREHHARLAMIYPDWFGTLPSTWIPVATMCEVESSGIAAGLSRTRRCMVYYSTDPESSGAIREQLHAFAPTLPRGVTMKFH